MGKNLFSMKNQEFVSGFVATLMHGLSLSGGEEQPAA
jgi:hypothetical protein